MHIETSVAYYLSIWLGRGAMENKSLNVCLLNFIVYINLMSLATIFYIPFLLYYSFYIVHFISTDFQLQACLGFSRNSYWCWLCCNFGGYWAWGWLYLSVLASKHIKKIFRGSFTDLKSIFFSIVQYFHNWTGNRLVYILLKLSSFSLPSVCTYLSTLFPDLNA